jgi:hypothetical protein
VPFCCDTRHAVPTAYTAEWDYLKANTDLWHVWQISNLKEFERIKSKTPSGHVLVECKGHLHCQRQFRSFTCRSFPFFPYIDQSGKFIGLAYYWEYEDRCWVINHLETVSLDYIKEFILFYQWVFENMPEEQKTFQYHSAVMRRIFGRKHRFIPLIDPLGQFYKVTPHNGRKRRTQANRFHKFGPYQVAAQLPFPDEIQ